MANILEGRKAPLVYAPYDVKKIRNANCSGYIPVLAYLLGSKNVKFNFPNGESRSEKEDYILFLDSRNIKISRNDYLSYFEEYVKMCEVAIECSDSFTYIKCLCDDLNKNIAASFTNKDEYLKKINECYQTVLNNTDNYLEYLNNESVDEKVKKFKKEYIMKIR